MAPFRVPYRRHAPALPILGLVFLGLACADSPEPTIQPMPQPDGYAPLIEPGPLSPRIANYRIAATLDPAAHRLRATQRLTFTNTGQTSLDVLPFHLYMNAFKNQSSVFMQESRGEHRRAKASSDAWGWIDVSSVRIAGAELVERVRYPHEPDETVMEVPLSQPLAPGATVEVDMAFEVQLPEVFSRTGYKGEFHMIGQWFPKIGVLVGAPGSERWHCEPFHLHSEFFADFGVYDVELTVPSTHVIAATGVLVRAADNGDGTRTLAYRAEDVHDFAWMADPYMRVMSERANTENGPVEVRVYHRPRQREFARRHLAAGVGAIEHFSALYRAYPWPIMNIIDPPLDAGAGAGGMEYPTLVTAAGDSFFLRPGMHPGEGVTIHEVGHNWFQGMLASNEVDEAWLDEGVNEYADWVVMNRMYGEGRSAMDWNGLILDTFQLETAAVRLAHLPVPIDIPSYEFPDPMSYGVASYLKTGVALATLESVVGRDELHAAMRAYAQEYAFRHPTGADFFASLERSLGRDLSWYVEPAFRGRGAAHFEVRDIECRPAHEPRGVFGRGQERRTVGKEEAPDEDGHRCDIMLVNLGSVPVPVDVAITFADGSERRERWQPVPGRAWHALQVEHTAPVERVTIDPDRVVLINDEWLARDVRQTEDRGASRRAAARVGFWTQSAMQVIGL